MRDVRHVDTTKPVTYSEFYRVLFASVLRAEGGSQEKESQLGLLGLLLVGFLWQEVSRIVNGSLCVSQQEQYCSDDKEYD